MDSAGYKIVLSLSHHRISFEYWLRDTETVLRPLPPGNWPERLAFYASPTGIKIGEPAAQAARRGIVNAFDNYFESSAGDETYVVAGQTRPVRNILLDAAETVFADFYRKVLLNRLNQLNDNRASMPLTIVCEADIKPNERLFLQGLFADSGYAKVNVENYDRLIGAYIKHTLTKEYDCKWVVIAWAEDNDLTFTLYEVGREDPVAYLTLPSLGIDPRKEYVKSMVWERIVSQNPWLNKESEDHLIEKIANDFLASSVPLVRGKVALSDGVEYTYSLNRAEIDFIPRNEGIKIKEELHRFLRENGVNDRGEALLLLRGAAAGNPYFEQNLSSGFLRTVKADLKMRDKVMQQLISQPSSLPAREAALPPKPKSVQPPTPEPIEERHREQVAESAQLSGGTDIKELKKRWREVKAAAKGKARAGFASEAAAMLDDFLKEVSSAGVNEEFISEVEALRKEFSASKTEKSAPSKPVNKPVSKPQVSNPSNRANPSLDSGRSEKMSEGEKLLSNGKIKEARDWFRNNGDVSKAKQLTDIIKARKGVEVRKDMLDACRRNKDRKQIERIISELEDYINACKKANVNADEFKSLLSEYKKIK